MLGLLSWVQCRRQQYRAWRATWPNTPNDWRKQLCAYYELYWQDHGWMRAFYNQPYEIAPGVFRSNQPSPRQIAKLAERGFKSVVNLRGASDCGQYYLEQQACQQHGLELWNSKLHSRQMPSYEKLEQLLQVFEQAPKPLLLHCKSGADRAGLASALYLLTQAKQPVALASQQLSIRFLHFKASKTGRLDHFLASYQPFEQQGMLFQDWLAKHYQPQDLQQQFKPQALMAWFVDVVLRRE